MGEQEAEEKGEGPKDSPQTEAQVLARARAVMRQIPEHEGGIPPWVRYPTGLRVPKGRRVIFMRFASRHTSRPDLGMTLPVEDEGALKIAGPGALWRQIICWEMSVGDEKLASSRSLGDQFRWQHELTKQFIRVIDGELVDESGANPDRSLEVFWESLGERYRRIVAEVWRSVHHLKPAEQADFFEHCIALATNVG